MTALEVSDVGSHRTAQIENAADALRNSPQLRAVFEAVYKGKKQPKSIEDLRTSTGIQGETRLLNLTQKLAAARLIERRREKNKTYCYKIPSIAAAKSDIIRMAKDSKKLDRYKMKNRPWATGKSVVVYKVPRTSIKIRALQITIDEIDSFSKVKKIDPSKAQAISSPLLEKKIKNGVRSVLKESWNQHDWGGETDDLYTTRVKLNKKRIATAFAFKGRSTKGVLTPKKMGKNGDQIQRLFRSPAELFIVQYQGLVDESVIEQMKAFASVKSITTEAPIYFAVIDGQDTARLVEAYPKSFK